MEWMQRCRDSVTVFAPEEREQCLGRLRDKDGCPVLYVQRGCAHAKEAEGEEHHDVHFGQEELQEALARWERFRGVLRALFPEEYPQGTVRSALQDVTEPLLDCAPLLPRGRHLLKRDDGAAPDANVC